MNADMIMGLVRQVLPFLGSMAVTLGYMEEASANNLVNQALIAVGAVMTVVGTAWTLKANTPASILQSADRLPEVRRIELNSSALKLKMGATRKTVVS